MERKHWPIYLTMLLIQVGAPFVFWTYAAPGYLTYMIQEGVRDPIGPLAATIALTSVAWCMAWGWLFNPEISDDPNATVPGPTPEDDGPGVVVRAPPELVDPLERAVWMRTYERYSESEGPGMARRIADHEVIKHREMVAIITAPEDPE